MRVGLVCLLCCLPHSLIAQAVDAPTVTIEATAELASSVLERVSEQTGLVVAGDVFVNDRRITVDFQAVPLDEALEALAIASVATWDSAYMIVSTEQAPDGPATPACWIRPPQTTLTLSGGSGLVEEIAGTLTDKCAAPIGYLPGLADARIITQKTDDAPIEDVLSGITGDNVAWTRGFWLAPIDRAAVFGRYATLPMEQCQERVLRHTEQMLKLDEDDVRQALFARHREFSALPADQREADIQVYAEQIRAGIAVLNTLSSEVRDRARSGMRIFFDVGLDVYRDLTIDEQIETTPIMEAMGELER